MAAIKMNAQQLEQRMADELPVLVDYWAPWCVYCRRIEPALDRVAEKFADKLVVAKINIDEEPRLAKQERIEVIPTLVLHRNGMAVDSIVAPESQAMIEAFLKDALSM